MQTHNNYSFSKLINSENESFWYFQDFEIIYPKIKKNLCILSDIKFI